MIKIKNEKLAIIIPYRDREEHRNFFIPAMEKHFSILGIKNYTFYFIEQQPVSLFNRGKLLNVGFQLAKDENDIFCFHDVDMIPRDLSASYKYNRYSPVHLSNIVSQFSDSFNPGYFGGVCLFTKEQFSKINGFYNDFWGWGAEDDDLNIRVQRRGLVFTKVFGKFDSLSHEPNGDAAGGYAGVETKPHIIKNREILAIHISDKTYNGSENGLNNLNFKVLEVHKLSDRSVNLKVII